MVDIVMERRGNCLVPVDAHGVEVIERLDGEAPVKCNVRNPKEKRRDVLNRLSHAIYREAARLLGEGTEEDEKALCKLHIAIPILMSDPDDGDECRDYYERLLRGVPYETRLERMKESHKFYIPATSLMNDDQMSLYCRRCVDYYGMKRGIVILTPRERQWLNDPEMQRQKAA